ncbi:OpgC domain-containing protein [Azospirillum aestuarii]|uniref:OpgC domain-containing protein n=1 Tax=Azospirillum aestuarii TaxID=2802052 RepID=UPI004055043C
MSGFALRGHFNPLVWRLAFLVTWLLSAGVEAASPAARWAGQALQRLFLLRFLRYLGGHSLQVYAYHVVLAYGIVLIDEAVRPVGALGKTGITVPAVASLALPAWLHGRIAVPAPRRGQVRRAIT